MTHIKLTTKHTGDARWLEAGADAWAVHCWALTYCDEQTTDGLLSRAMAERLALPVAPDRAPAAVDRLLDLGLWAEASAGKLQIVDYDTYGLLSGEIQQTRARWAGDKRIQRMHNNGVHDECRPKRCLVAARMSTADTPPDNRSDTPADRSTDTRRTLAAIPDPTRPNGRGGSGSGRSAGSGGPTPTAGQGNEPPLEPHVHELPVGVDPESPGASRRPCQLCGNDGMHLVHWAHDFKPDPEEPESCEVCGEHEHNLVHTWPGAA